MSERVSIAIDGEGIADVRLNRPNKLNACDLEMIEALGTAGSELAKNRSLRAVVLSGEGKGFCAGLDVALFLGVERNVEELLERDTESPANFVQRAAWTWTALSVPVIAALGGVWLLSEEIHLRLIVAALLILGGIAAAVTVRR